MTATAKVRHHQRARAGRGTSGRSARRVRDYADAGVEGVVVKHREHGYRPRRRSWFKVGTRTTADAVVGGGIGPLDAPEALLPWACRMTPDGCGWPVAPRR